jgi:4-amino-4-deoxy-L-arabinose transferase-like glycosyltransferase
VDAAKVPGGRLAPLGVALKRPGLGVVVLILLGLALRLSPLLHDPLHQDEALYGFWGRLISSGRDPWLTTVAVDKPPLVPYLIAGSQAAFGVSEFAIRMPDLAASMLSIPLVYALACRLYRDRRVGLVAAAVMALTPYPVLFGAAAFTDAVLVGWVLAACYAALSDRWGWAGLLLGLAFASKQQAVVLAPLVVGLGLIGWQSRAARGNGRVASLRFVLGLAPVVMGVLAWDAIRVANGAGAGFWNQGVESYGGLRLIWPAELEPRWHGWTRLGGYLLGWPWVLILFLGCVAVLLWHDLTRRPRTRAAAADLVLSGFVLGCFFLHWLVAFPVWDRYLLPLVPMVGLLLGRGVALTWDEARARSGGWSDAFRIPSWAFSVLLALLLVVSGLRASDGRIPVGGDHGAYDGLEEAVGFLRALPVGTVLYDRWLSWHYDFYLFDAYLYRAGFAAPEWLAADAASFYDGRPRYLVIPRWESTARLERALGDVGLAMAPILTTYDRDGAPSFVVYEIGAREIERGG